MTSKGTSDELKKLREVWENLKPWQRKVLRWQGEVVYAFTRAMMFIYRADLWLFPPAAFFSAYNLATKNIPDHPIKNIVALGIATMCSSFTMLVIRPKRRIHWVRS